MVPGKPVTTHASSAPDVNPEFERVRRYHPPDRSVPQTAFDFSTLQRQIAATIPAYRVPPATTHSIAQIPQQQLYSGSRTGEHDCLDIVLQQPTRQIARR